MRPEFDPKSEKHFVAMVVKFVDPGCTLELQIEESDGTVTRLTSTENPTADKSEFMLAVTQAFERSMKRFKI